MRGAGRAAAEYAEQGRGFDLRNVAGGWRYYTREESRRSWSASSLDGQQARLTQAALETLAVVAYKQPVSRARVSAIRGVNVDGVMRTLLTRGLVEEAGQDEQTTAALYRTTSYFLERIGMASLDELPGAGAVPAGHGRAGRPRRAPLTRTSPRTTGPCMIGAMTLRPTPGGLAPATPTGWSGSRSCSPSPGWPVAVAARS